MKEKILIVDDKPDMVSFLKRLITEELQLEPLTALNAREALSVAVKHSPDIVVLDIKMPGMDGMEALQRLKEIDGEMIVIILTGYGTVEMAVEALKIGAYDFLTKPLNNERFVHTLKKAIQFRRVLKEKRFLEEAIRREKLKRELIGETPVMKKLR